MKYAVDRIIDNIAVLENIETKEIKEVELSILPENIKEGNIVKEETTYILDKEEENIRRQRIAEKLNRLKHLKDENND